jgi:ATP-binding cassette subfamily B protein
VGVGDLPRIDDGGAVAAALVRTEGGDIPGRLDGGLESQLGRQFGGTELSTGQWQKVAVARAVLREAPTLLVLDEPSSGLDARAEHALLERYADAARAVAESTGAVTVLVSHRFSTVRSADLIVVLDRGRVVEQGTHDELMALGGVYAALYSVQARAYG